MALNKKTGEFAGEDDAGIGPRIYHGQWSSPSAGVVNGKPLVFFGGGDGWLYSFEPKTGKLIEVRSKVLPVFKVGKELKNRVNQGTS